MPRKPNPERLDNDSPEATEEWFAKARPAKDVLADLMDADVAKEMLKPKRGRPPASRPKEHVNIRLDADILDAFKDRGAGWQTRINTALRDWLKTHPNTRKA
ncbi:BrnA antitoxin family protein [Aquabacterium parvum]|uniref:BrnA antitoxin family protein n=1 Tax=Aquabacterium parvum TaxID=70584 RepID=UPI000718B85B|nr:BrnA antitoxin family protein [Aquabacterium parvum]